MEKQDRFYFLKTFLAILIILDIVIWFFIFSSYQSRNLALYFLSVGQGDSSLIMLPNNHKILIDGGPMNGRLNQNLEQILPANDRYIDLIIISHPQLDHFGGFINLLKTYKIGAVLTSHAQSQNASWKEMEKLINDKKIPRIVLNTGDKIKYLDTALDIISPDKGAFAKDVNDLSISILLNNKGIKGFFAGDASAKLEKRLANIFNVNADILKVSHHGSKYSSDSTFLKEASPAVSVIGVGKNSYGHPTKEALYRLQGVGSRIFRTDKNGLIKIDFTDEGLRVYSAL